MLERKLSIVRQGGQYLYVCALPIQFRLTNSYHQDFMQNSFFVTREHTYMLVKFGILWSGRVQKILSISHSKSKQTNNIFQLL